jgi:hypothetical protein
MLGRSSFGFSLAKKEKKKETLLVAEISERKGDSFVKRR